MRISLPQGDQCDFFKKDSTSSSMLRYFKSLMYNKDPFVINERVFYV